MHDDPADLEGDGQFDLIDLVIMGEEDDGEKTPSAQSGCLVLLVPLGSFLITAWWGCMKWLA